MDRQPVALEHRGQRLYGEGRVSAQITMTDINGKYDASETGNLYTSSSNREKKRGTERKERERLVQVCYRSIACLNIPEEGSREMHQTGACEHIVTDLLEWISFLPAEIDKV